MKLRNASDAYQTIANDFYKYNAKEYLQTLSKYYDGQLKKIKETYHLIVFNPNIIKVVGKTRYSDSDPG